mmetsp:Transcript_6236/g.25261  ORF Transcript_6236/g.25261 Transcript_6236/m.25261 type:complete len:242 (+) Transcript_6236:730-1455(+)
MFCTNTWERRSRLHQGTPSTCPRERGTGWCRNRRSDRTVPTTKMKMEKTKKTSAAASQTECVSAWTCVSRTCLARGGRASLCSTSCSLEARCSAREVVFWRLFRRMPRRNSRNPARRWIPRRKSGTAPRNAAGSSRSVWRISKPFGTSRTIHHPNRSGTRRGSRRTSPRCPRARIYARSWGFWRTRSKGKRSGEKKIDAPGCTTKTRRWRGTRWSPPTRYLETAKTAKDHRAFYACARSRG